MSHSPSVPPILTRHILPENAHRLTIRRPTPLTPTVTKLPTPNVQYASIPSTPSSTTSSGPSCSVKKNTSDGHSRYQIEIVNTDSSSSTTGGKRGERGKSGKSRKSGKRKKTRRTKKRIGKK